MASSFSKPVEQALEYIYYDMRSGHGQEALRLLEEASAAGDGDASCVLARCLCGDQYVWSGHGFPEDDERATRLMQLGVEQGSAAAVLLCLRSGELTPSLEQKMPFDSLKAAFEDVLEKARSGEHFCEYMVGNVYFWWDFTKIDGKGPDSFPDFPAFQAYLKENIAKCEDWLWKAYRGGIFFAGNNLNKLYQDGDEDLIPPRPEKAKGIWRTGAELGYPPHQKWYADELLEAGDNAGALNWYKQAAEGGEAGGWYGLGSMYADGKGVPADPAYAASCWEKGAAKGSIGSMNLLGKACYYGTGIPQDYGRAVQLLGQAFDEGSDWGAFYLASCYFNGWGAPKDYKRVLEILDKASWCNKDMYYMLGVIYGQGLGVAADIPKAVGYLQKAGDLKEAKEELLHYKKTLFGKWVRR